LVVIPILYYAIKRRPRTGEVVQVA
jgi:hypothetical protein